MQPLIKKIFKKIYNTSFDAVPPYNWAPGPEYAVVVGSSVAVDSAKSWVVVSKNRIPSR